ncbi:MAG: polysaccharide biosynthesis tyrosine autokinase [Verrucomicrobiae bacterium]|nr:polysaccharide biosynthesis tyrosine autokinase [Verrucomicrobiae bacterium]
MQISQSGQAEDNRLHFLDYWRIIRLRKGIIFLNFIVIVLAATFLTYLLPKQYKSVVRMEVHKDVGDIAEIGQVTPVSDYDPYFILTQFERLQSADVLYPVIEDMKLDQVWSARMGGSFTRQQAKEFLTRAIRPNQVRNTSIIELEVYSRDRAEAAAIANKIAAVYKRNRDLQRIGMSESSIVKLRQKLLEQSNTVAQADSRVNKIRQETGIDLVFESAGRIASTLDTERLKALEMMSIEFGADYAQKKTQLDELKKLLPEELRNAILTVKPQEILLGRLLEQYTTAKQEMVSKGRELGPSHPDILRMEGVIAEISLQIENRIRGIMLGLESELEALRRGNEERQKQLVAAKQTNREAAEKASMFLEAQKTLEREQRVYDTIELKIEQEDVNRSIPRESAVQVIDPAEPAIKAAWPKPSLNIAAGIILGLLVGVGIAFFIEYLDTSVKTIDDVEKALDAPVLAVIPQNVGTLLEEGLDTPHAEPYRVLRTNILFTCKNPDLKTITVVSGGAGEGKSTTIINLATIFAQNGSKVLLVDSDLRRPSLHKRIDKENSPGLTDYLLGKKGFEEVVQPTQQANLDFLPSGKLPSSAMGILNSQQMRDFIKMIRTKYDYVLFDSPPLIGVSDATVLASGVDMTLLVIQYRKYPQSLALRSRQMVEKVGGRLLGVVLNNINVSNDASYYYYSGVDYNSENTSDVADENPPGKVKRSGESKGGTEADLKSQY